MFTSHGLALPKDYESFSLISIDPGTRFMGVATYKVRFADRHILDASSECWHIENMRDMSGLSEEDHSFMTIKLARIRDHFRQVLLEVQPAAVICERPFFNRFKPNAFAAILRVLEALQGVILEVNPSIAFHLLEPFVVKMRVGATLNSDKDKVKEALQDKDVFKTLACYEQLATMEKDAIDALAVGYAYLDESRDLIAGLEPTQKPKKPKKPKEKAS